MLRAYQSNDNGFSASTFNTQHGKTADEASDSDHCSDRADGNDTLENRFLESLKTLPPTRSGTRISYREDTPDTEEAEAEEDEVGDAAQSTPHDCRHQPSPVDIERGDARRVDQLGPRSATDPDLIAHNKPLKLLDNNPFALLESSGTYEQVALIGSSRGRPTTMHVSGYSPSNRPSNNIVEEYLSPINDVYTGDFLEFKSLTDSEKQGVIEREAEEYGLEKPQGYNVSFHYNPHVEYHHFGSSHPMKPWRLTLTKQLVLSYGLEYTMDLYEPRPANFNELAIFHDREYLSYLSE